MLELLHQERRARHFRPPWAGVKMGRCVIKGPADSGALKSRTVGLRSGKARVNI